MIIVPRQRLVRAVTQCALALLLIFSAHPVLAETPVAASFEARIAALDPEAALKGPKKVIAEGLSLVEQAQHKKLSPLLRARLLRYLAEGYFRDAVHAEALKHYRQSLAFI